MLSSLEMTAFNVDSMLLLEFSARERIPFDDVVPALFSTVVKLWPQLFAFWKNPATPLKSELRTEESEVASNVKVPSYLLLRLIPSWARPEMLDPSLLKASAVLVAVSLMEEVTVSAPFDPAVPESSASRDPLASVIT